tara:strand:- start:18700 stop:19755 length:1056 start_codon:yes stop_codon:yes gene_type:complete
LNFTKTIQIWYKSKNISLPWRGETDLYKIWLSEVMLQQTQVNTVIPYYTKWLKKFPSLESVANANEDELLKYWEGLGYYSRVRNFQFSCKIVLEKFNRKIPKNSKEFLKLRGVGEYIHAAVYSIGLNKKIPVIDGNVKRVISRYLCFKKDIESEKKKIFKYLSKEILKTTKPGDFNQAIMDLGRLICKPKNPNCIECPISSNCLALKNNMIHQIPLKVKRAKTPKYNTVVGIIEKNNKILLCKRNTKGLLGGMWELPNGKIEPKESQKQALKRVLSNFGLDYYSQIFLGTVKHQYSHFSIDQKGYKCQYKSGNLISKYHSEYKWININEKSNYPIHKASHKILNKIKVKNL